VAEPLTQVCKGRGRARVGNTAVDEDIRKVLEGQTAAAAASTQQQEVAATSPVEVSSTAEKEVRDQATTNFRLKLSGDGPGVVEYQASFSSEKELEGTFLKRSALDQFEDALGTVRRFDGKVLFLPRVLEKDVSSNFKTTILTIKQYVG